jgi:hypothetical protein
MPTPRWERFEAFLWRTSSLLVVVEGESLVVDPAISADEVAAIDRRALELGAPVRQVLITHGDWDHVCGIGGFPDAVVAMGEETAAKVEDDSRVQSIQRAVEAYGFVSSGSPRVDETFARGRAVALGECTGKRATGARGDIPEHWPRPQASTLDGEQCRRTREHPATGGAQAVTDPVSWLQIGQGWNVTTSDGVSVGTVAQVEGDKQSDIFDGLAVESKQPTQIRYVPGEQVGAIHPGEVTLKIASADIGMLEPFQAPPPETKWLPGKAPLASRMSNWLRRKR